MQQKIKDSECVYVYVYIRAYLIFSHSFFLSFPPFFHSHSLISDMLHIAYMSPHFISIL